MQVSLFRRGRVWWVNYRHRGKRFRRSLRTENKKVAEDLRCDLEYKLRRGEVPGRPRTVAIADFLEEFRAYSKGRKRPKSHRTDMRRVEAFFKQLDAVNLEDVETADVVAYFTKKALDDSVGPTTILRIRESLHAFFNHAVRLGRVKTNPVSATVRPKVPQRDPRFLSQDQIAELQKAVAGDGIAALVMTAVYAGLRREELCWLTPDDVDRDGAVPLLRVRSKRVRGEEWMPKTKRNRAIPISPKLDAVLRVMPKARGPWLFPSPERCRWEPNNLSRRLRELMKRAGLPWGFLDFRHTFGSQLARNNVSLVKIAQLMGNSPQIARRHYVNLIPEELAADVEF